MDKSLNQRLKEKLEERNVSVPLFEEKTGIPKDRVYKWLKRDNAKISHEDAKIVEDWINGNMDTIPNETYLQKRRGHKLAANPAKESQVSGIPIYDVPIDASFIERYTDQNYFEPLYFLNIPKLRNCNFGAVVSGSSMYPVMKSGSIAICRVVTDLGYFDPGEMYFLSTTNGFETVKYVQPCDDPECLLLIPHNEKIKPTTIQKNMVIKMCIVEAWINFR